jgi:hypothetical protein
MRDVRVVPTANPDFSRCVMESALKYRLIPPGSMVDVTTVSTSSCLSTTPEVESVILMVCEMPFAKGGMKATHCASDCSQATQQRVVRERERLQW